jgi:hypothetical protein
MAATKLRSLAFWTQLAFLEQRVGMKGRIVVF